MEILHKFLLKTDLIRRPTSTILCLSYSKYSKLVEYRRCYEILGIPEGSDQEEIRKAYLKLVKKYHPDSGTQQASSEKFSEIDKAFKMLINKLSKERWNVEDDAEVHEQDIKHTAPQHRQYLSYGGIGSGNPFQREKQYTKIRAIQAAENVLKHKISKVAAEEGALLVKTPLKHKIQTKYGFDRLVEDLIQESMSKGEFNNLSGSGKPLKSHENRNPYVDFVTHKLNQVLIDNGFTPEWIMLQKEIREQISHLRDCLASERIYFAPFPLNNEDHADWDSTVFKYKDLEEKINKLIDKFNLVVPIMDKQMIQIDLNKEAHKILVNGENNLSAKSIQRKSIKNFPNKNNSQVTDSSNPDNVYHLLESIFRLK